jgi:hypothetical protein
MKTSSAFYGLLVGAAAVLIVTVIFLSQIPADPINHYLPAIQIFFQHSTNGWQRIIIAAVGVGTAAALFMCALITESKAKGKPVYCKCCGHVTGYDGVKVEK